MLSPSPSTSANMMKLASIFKSRGSNSGQLLGGAQDVFMGSARFSTVALKASTVAQNASTVAQKASTFALKAPIVAQKASTGGRIFAPFKLYKGKAAFNAEPVAPTFTKNEAGDLFVKRSGFILLTFSPSIGERKYDWERKQVFALSPTEVGSLISLGPGGSCDFFHDPGMQTSNAGQVRKSLQVKGNPDGNYLITLNVVDKVKKLNEYLAVQATPGEFAVIRTSFSFALPHIMGWDQYSNRPPPMKAEYSNTPSPMKEFSSEWDR
ncbi:single-stranded DNA-binding protein WHY2, mitochondrial-like [Silene latifolia]|uniref:single-stranded DNA-binding protein WHY2, mitochondrial-like n=1 Tax=Silene latifolia TaxID=37657 RepID=UPI003D773DFF